MQNDPRLTYRELEIIKLVAKGYSNKEIGIELKLCSNTVKTYIAQIYRHFNFGYGNPRVRLTNWYHVKYLNKFQQC